MDDFIHVTSNIVRKRDFPTGKWRCYRQQFFNLFALNLEDYYPEEIRKIADDMERVAAIEAEGNSC